MTRPMLLAVSVLAGLVLPGCSSEPDEEAFLESVRPLAGGGVSDDMLLESGYAACEQMEDDVTPVLHSP